MLTKFLNFFLSIRSLKVGSGPGSIIIYFRSVLWIRTDLVLIRNEIRILVTMFIRIRIRDPNRIRINSDPDPT